MGNAVLALLVALAVVCQLRMVWHVEVGGGRRRRNSHVRRPPFSAPRRRSVLLQQHQQQQQQWKGSHSLLETPFSWGSSFFGSDGRTGKDTSYSSSFLCDTDDDGHRNANPSRALSSARAQEVVAHVYEQAPPTLRRRGAHALYVWLVQALLEAAVEREEQWVTLDWMTTRTKSWQSLHPPLVVLGEHKANHSSSRPSLFDDSFLQKHWVPLLVHVTNSSTANDMRNTPYSVTNHRNTTNPTATSCHRQVLSWNTPIHNDGMCQALVVDNSPTAPEEACQDISA